MAVWRPPPKPERTIEQRLVALERVLLPTSKPTEAVVDVQLCPKCHATSFRVVSDHGCSLPDCTLRHLSLCCVECQHQEIRTDTPPPSPDKLA